jgi:hypothetical protein
MNAGMVCCQNRFGKALLPPGFFDLSKPKGSNDVVTGQATF